MQAHGVDSDQLDELTRSAIQLFEEQGIQAARPRGAPARGEKGEPITMGVILLAIITSGTAVAVLKVAQTLLDRRRTLRFRVERDDGAHFDLDAERINREEFDALAGQLKRFLGSQDV